MEGGVLIRTSAVLYALLVTSVHIIIDLMVVILDSNYMYIYIYIYIHTCMHTYVRTYIHTYIPTFFGNFACK